MFVKPKPGLKIRDPQTKQWLPDEGGEVPEDQFWTRRLLCGDVLTAQIPDTSGSGAGEVGQ